MSFNPSNMQLQRVAFGVNRHKFIQLNRQKTFFGRATGNDVCFSSLKCSKKHCEVYFYDGRIFVKDLNSKMGTFVNDTKIEPNTEIELFENDLVGFGSRTVADNTSKTTLIYSLKKAESFEIESDLYDSDVEEVIADTTTELKCASNLEDEITNETNDEVEEAESPLILTASVEIKSAAKKLQNKDVAPPTDFDNKIQKLRHWKKPAAVLIDPLPMKRSRKLKDATNVSGSRSTVSPSRKRGRPKLTEEAREQLRNVNKKKEPKAKKIRKKRVVKIKNTEENRGAFLTQTIPIRKRGRPRKNAVK